MSDFKPSTYASNIEEAVRDPLLERIKILEEENAYMKIMLDELEEKGIIKNWTKGIE